jgi:predicted RNA-binding protein with PIN domain
MHIVIDGYNLIYSPGRFAGKGPTAPDERLREYLITQLAAYREIKGSPTKSAGAEPGERPGAGEKPAAPPPRVTVVFDSHPHGWPYSVSEEHLGVEVVYSGPGVEADETIKQMVRESSHSRDMLVVTSDLSLQSICRRLGAQVTDSASFREEVFRELRRAREEQPEEPLAKEEGVPESEIDAWLASLGLDEEPPSPDDSR